MLHPPSAEEARITEIFSSLQGEGTHLGERHLFIRFEECHMHCGYCDELGKPARAMHLDELLQAVLKYEATEGPHRFVSLTGGEPLLYLSFLKPLMRRLKELGFRTYLETSGVLWPALKQVLEWTDCIAMDMKPGSVTGEGCFRAEHRKFLEIALEKELMVKLVLSRSIDIPEFEAMIEDVAQVSKSIPVILQPLSSEREGHEDQELMSLLETLQRVASVKVDQVRIVPRFHRILQIR